ncbi:hypothetical protein EYF80_039912 [Liparis tanakae]|uniref:Uncharacterized protein n=1 Tax=Liparis tanakae TaxID=230148 RepID=A0A4Z2G9I3_9TELE|nr:hypothetical protein EYF80_039912 [Liparis tanakae]
MEVEVEVAWKERAEGALVLEPCGIAAASSQEALKTHGALLLHNTKQQTHTVIHQPLTSVEHLAAKDRYLTSPRVQTQPSTTTVGSNAAAACRRSRYETPAASGERRANAPPLR